MRKTTRLRLEPLEDRCNPSTLGQPWADPGNLTLSFAPDGTQVGGTTSTLFQTLNQVAPTSQWEQVILKAFQTWVPSANVNIGLVSDGGQPFGIDGAPQGDPRFGDIRIGMAALPANLVATTSPFSWTGSTWSGDLVLNSSYNFGVNGQGDYDLFTVVAHEAGHAFGIGDNTTDSNSIMFANYTGPRTGPDAQDVANIQTLYGARNADTQGNGSLATATALGNTPAQLGLVGDIATATDVEYYKVVTPSLPGSALSVTFQVHAAGLSLLEPTVSVYDGSAQLVGTASATDPFSNNVSVTLNSVDPCTTYYFAVSSASTDVFSVGTYTAQVSYQSAGASITGVVPSLVPGAVNTASHANTSMPSSTTLTAPFGQAADQRFNYLYQANLAYGGDTDYYQFQAPSAPSSTGTYALDAIVWQTEVGGLAPAIHLFDANGNPLALQVLANTNSLYSVQLSGVSPGQMFYVEVAGQTKQGSHSYGGYVYGVKFNEQPETVAPAMAGNTLSTATSTDSGVLAMNQNGVYYFELAAANGSSTATSVVQMTVYDTNGNEVTSLTAVTGAAPRTLAVFLPAATYQVVFSVVSTTGNYQPVTYWLTGEVLSQPIGPYYSGSNPPPASSSATAPASGGSINLSSMATFASDGASVTVQKSDGTTISVPIPAPGSATTQTFTTAAGTTTLTLTTTADGTTTLTLTTPAGVSITDTITTSGATSSETMTTSDGLQVIITMPVTTAAPSYTGPSSGPLPPRPYQY